MRFGFRKRRIFSEARGRGALAGGRAFFEI